MVVPGSGLVKKQAEAEGLDKIFLAAGFEWREPGCSMCLAMNPDKLEPGERCASTSNRNFEGRQGYQRPHASGLAGHGGGGGDRRAFRRCAAVGVEREDKTTVLRVRNIKRQIKYDLEKPFFLAGRRFEAQVPNKDPSTVIYGMLSRQLFARVLEQVKGRLRARLVSRVSRT